MPIDDPVSSLQSLNASDERQRSPLSRFAKDFLALVKLLSLTGAEMPVNGIQAVLDWLGQREEKNREELVSVIAEELNHRGSQIETLIHYEFRSCPVYGR
jgi:hypothetical protein